jgi:preprotein translocase subunit SecF
MEQLTSKNKIIYGLALLIIIVGIIVVVAKGFNVGLDYMPNQKIEIYIGKQFDLKDIKDITNEVFENQKVSIKKVELFEDMVSISSKEITEEQRDNLVQKINEKYELETDASNTSIIAVPNIKLIDVAKKYILPLTISFILILVYLGIRFFKINSLKVILKTIIDVVIVELVFGGILAITRIEIGRYVMPIALVIFALTVFYLTAKFEKQLANKKIEEEKE